MNAVLPLDEFLNSPTTVDFIVENSEYFRNYVKDKPYIVPTVVLTGGYLIAYVDEERIEDINRDIGSTFSVAESTVLGLLGERALEAAGILQVQQQPFLSLRGQGVLVGIVDTGIDYTQDVFRYEDGTSKIASIFDQTTPGTLPYGFLIGAEYTQEQINTALASEDPLSVVPVTDPVGHGTFLASVAAGRETGSFIGAAPDSELIVVKLKTARPYYRRKYLVPPDQENAYESTSIMAGVEYIIKKAQELGRPVAICIGMGTNFGSHDGFSLFEEYLSEISRLSGHAICIAAGNESDQRHHYLGQVAEDGSQNIELRVGSNAGDIYMTMWSGAADRLSVSLTSPIGEVVERIPARAQSRLETRLILEPATVIVEYEFPSRGTGGQNTVIKILDATPGIWTITVFGDIILEGTYHVWLPITGFVSPNVEFLEPNPNYTVTLPATCFCPITCGGYNDVQKSLYQSTSWGPNRLEILMPDLVAPCVNVTGIYPYGPGIMTGTSIAAAITTGAAALMLEWGVIEGNDIAMTTSKINAYLIRGATRFPAVEYPNNQWGYGVLNLFRSFELMR